MIGNVLFFISLQKRGLTSENLSRILLQDSRPWIEMRQIGVRDEAKMIGSLGICGREVCCSRFLTSFEPISIKMAKKQELVLNTGKLSGVCGRLMCCLGFEYTEKSQEDVALTEASSVSISEDAGLEMVIASSDLLEGLEGPVAQSGTGSQQHAPKLEQQEHKERYRKH